MEFSRPLNTQWDYNEAAPHIWSQPNYSRGYIYQAGTPGYKIQAVPMMQLSQNSYIPAPLDPSDPKTWDRPVRFTGVERPVPEADRPFLFTPCPGYALPSGNWTGK